MPNLYPFPAQATAKTFSDAVDASLGIPNVGTPIGGGIHCPGPTMRYGDTLQHPTLALWGYPADATVVPLAPTVAAQKGIAVPAPVAQDATWAGAVAVAPVVT